MPLLPTLPICPGALCKLPWQFQADLSSQFTEATGFYAFVTLTLSFKLSSLVILGI